MANVVPWESRYYRVPAGPPPGVIAPGTAVYWCRCGGVVPIPKRGPGPSYDRDPEALAALKAWEAVHLASRDLHRVVADYWRAPCKPFVTGCRNCGRPPTGRKLFYCSDACRLEFEPDHFWGTARDTVIKKARVADGALGVAYCVRGCGRFGTEVNHIVPLNGDRPAFGCCHHQANLELLCHADHLVTTAEQRAAGLIGRALRSAG